MSAENSKIDSNNKPSMLAVTDDATAELRRILVDPITGRLKCSAVMASVVSDTAYGADWNGVTTIAPSKNAVYDKIESMGGGVGGSGTINELAYWTASTTLGTLAVATYPSLVELSYIKGLSSAVQTQLNAKAAVLGADDNYVTDAEKIVIGNTSGTNTGDNAANSSSTYIGTTAVALNRASAALTLASITLTTPDIGTPSAGTLTNCTGLPYSGLANGTDGNLITWDASGVAALVDTGNAGQVLTSNGAGAAPTFQAATGGGASCVTVIPIPATPPTGTPALGTCDTNTEGMTGQFIVPFSITVNKISFRTGTVTTTGTLDLTLYSENGQTQLFSVTTGTITATTDDNKIITTAVGSVSVPAGNYYLMINSNTTANVQVYFYDTSGTPFNSTEGLASDVASEPILHGTITITASTPPATITPVTSLNGVNNRYLCFRLDN